MGAPELQVKVMADFNPLDSSRDWNGIFLKFVEGIESASGASGEIERFVVKWNLGDAAVRALHNLRPAKLRVMKEFAPRDTDRDANGIFLRFVEGVEKGKGDKGKGGFGKGKGCFM